MNFFQEKSQIIQDLEQAVKGGKINDQKVNDILDSLSTKLGASGKERINIVNFLFKEVIDKFIPRHLKRLL